jgi:hypothetical protein
MDHFFNIAIALGLPLLFYLVIAYANRRFKQIDQELERRSEAASLTSTELKALVHEAVSESLSALQMRLELNEQRLDGVEQQAGLPAGPQKHLVEPRPSHGSTQMGSALDPDDVEPEEGLPSQRRLRGR